MVVINPALHFHELGGEKNMDISFAQSYFRFLQSLDHSWLLA